MSDQGEQVEAMEQRVLNARTIEAARRLHDELDALRERRDGKKHRTPVAARPGTHGPAKVTSADYERGYNSGYVAGHHATRSAGPGLDVGLLVAALVEVEEQKISAHPECLTDTCDHEKCPDWGSLGCGDAQAIAAAYNRLAAARLPVERRTWLDVELLAALERVQASAVQNNGRLTPSAILDIQTAINALAAARLTVEP